MMKEADLMSDDMASALACVSKAQIDQAISIIEKTGGPSEVADAYGALVKRVYRETRDVTAMIALAEAASKFCLREAALVSEADAKRLRERVKAIAYNAAANCWPGWGDEGIVIKPEHVQAGLKLALLSRDLVRELRLSNKQLGNAHWLVGALELASSRLSDAAISFSQAEQASRAQDDKARVLMAQGYVALAHKMDSQSHTEGEAHLADVFDKLRAEGSKEAVFFAEQIARADPLLTAFVRLVG
jgi:hypothetical protein